MIVIMSIRVSSWGMNESHWSSGRVVGWIGGLSLTTNVSVTKPMAPGPGCE